MKTNYEKSIQETKAHINEVIQNGNYLIGGLQDFISQLERVSTVDSPVPYKDLIVTLNIVLSKFSNQITMHDASKLMDPEVSTFAEVTDKLKGLTYGSDEYKAILSGPMKMALDNHYKMNSHHPEHYKLGIQGMNTEDVMELMCDWLASCHRHANGDISQSLIINQKRFKYTDDFRKMLGATIYTYLPMNSTERKNLEIYKSEDTIFQEFLKNGKRTMECPDISAVINNSVCI